LFGLTFGVTRVSTVVLVLVSSVAFYGLCLALGVTRRWATLGTGIYLFNPVGYALTFSYMTDAHLMALAVCAMYGYVRGLSAKSPAWIVGGSVLAALAILSRPQGAAVPAVVFIWLVAVRRIRLGRPGLVLAAQVLAAPLAAALGYFAWIAAVGGPATQSAFVTAMRKAGIAGNIELADHTLYTSLMYLGLFALPFTIAAARRLRPPLQITARGWVVVGVWAAVLVRGAVRASHFGWLMPYSGGWFNNTGLGSIHDTVVGGRPILAGRSVFVLLTVVCFASSLLLAMLLVRPSATVSPTASRLPLLVALTAVVMAVGMLPASSFFGGMIDRYFLAVLPFALVFIMSRIREGSLAVGWLIVAGFAIFSVAGTRDALVLEQQIWMVADRAVASGVPPDRLDGGASWDGWQHWGNDQASPGHWLATGAPPPTTGPWWVRLFAPVIRADYVVATAPQPGYHIVEDVAYSSWLQRGPTHVFLLRRDDDGGP
jgi:hypothetical protein